MNKSKNGLFTATIILVAVHLVFTLAANIIFFCVGYYGYFGITEVLDLLTGTVLPVAADVLVILGLAMKKKLLPPIGLFIIAGSALVNAISGVATSGLFSGYYTDGLSQIFSVQAIASCLATTVFNVAFALLLFGLYKLLENPDPNHPFAKKHAPKAAPVVPYVMPQQPMNQYAQQPQAPVVPYAQPQQPAAPVDPYAQPQAPANPYAQPQQPQAPGDPYSPM
ncbi:MAG: hypothetical protein IJ168_10675 [Eubacterium sp.]|nr:hypothetical protein [Eubacterium sp.]